MANEAPRLDQRLALTIREAADAIGVSENHLRTVLSEIPHRHVGRRVVIPVDKLREWLLKGAETEKQQTQKIADSVLHAVHDE